MKKARVAKASCAAIIVQVIRPGHEKRHKVEIYSETFARSAGEEYGLQDALSKAIGNALSILNVNPMCCIVWRDGRSLCSCKCVVLPSRSIMLTKNDLLVEY